MRFMSCGNTRGSTENRVITKFYRRDSCAWFLFSRPLLTSADKGFVDALGT